MIRSLVRTDIQRERFPHTETEGLLDVPLLPGSGYSKRGLTSRRNVTDSHRSQDFLMVSTAPDRFQTGRATLPGRFIGQQLPYPRKRAVLSKGAGSSPTGRGLNVIRASRERWRTNGVVRSPPPFSSLYPLLFIQRRGENEGTSIPSL